jgi:hypothetical protein
MTWKAVELTPHAPSVPLAARSRLAERRRVLRRESMRDFVGVAIGVVLGALGWIAFLSFVRVAL